jgi:Lrp/AsnC family leucine-responsive transcriptional regulator
VQRQGLDQIDQVILRALVEDARRSATDIGRRVSLSPSATARRIERLEKLGVITGYRATIDHAQLGDTIEAFAELHFEGATQVGDIDKAFASLPELVEAFTIAGDPDALVRIRARNVDHLKTVIDSIRRSGRVTGTKTLIVLGATRGTSGSF